MPWDLFPGVLRPVQVDIQPETGPFPKAVKEPVCWGSAYSVGNTGGWLYSVHLYQGRGGSAPDCQPLPLKQTCSLLSLGGSVQGEAVHVGQGALAVGQVWGRAIHWTDQGSIQVLPLTTDLPSVSLSQPQFLHCQGGLTVTYLLGYCEA